MTIRSTGIRARYLGETAGFRRWTLEHPNGLTLLIVDDEASIAKGLTTLFQRRGYVAVSALTSAEALWILRSRRIDGLLIDFRIPDTRGDVLFSAAVALQPHLAKRTIFLTGDISDVVGEALVDMAAPIVLKPFEVAELERVVIEVIGAATDDRRDSDAVANDG